MRSWFSRKKKRWLVVAVAVVLAAGGAGAWLLLTPSEGAAEMMTATASVGSQRQTVSASGTIEPADRADLSFTVSGKVVSVDVAEGDTVTEGQMLATIDDALLQATVDAAQSSLDAAKAQLDEDTADGASDNRIAADRAGIVRAESELSSAQSSLKQAQLRAPIAGTVASLDLRVGDEVSAGSGPTNGANGGSDTDATGKEPAPRSSGAAQGSTAATGSSAQVTIVSTNRFVVEANVGSSAVASVKAGLQAEITPVGATKAVYGTVKSVGKVASADSSGAAAFPVTIEVTGERDDLYAGSSATVSIIVKQRNDVLTVPSQALHNEGTATYVNRVVNGERVRTDVEIGTAYGAQTEVVSGLSEGDEVEITGFTRTPGGGGERQVQRGGQLPGGARFPGGGGR